MRLFIGVPLAAAVIDELRAASARLHSAGGGLRWTAPESWHVTLQFLGNTNLEQYACVIAHLRALQSPPVPVCLEELGCFERAGVLIAVVRLTPELLLLQERVTSATQPCGFVPEAPAAHYAGAQQRPAAASRPAQSQNPPSDEFHPLYRS